METRRLKKSKKPETESESEYETCSDTESDSEYLPSDEEKIDKREFNVLLNSLFPSKFMKKKCEVESDSDDEPIRRRRADEPKYKIKRVDSDDDKPKRKNKKVESESDDKTVESESESEAEEKINITFSIVPKKEEIDDYKSEDEHTFMKEHTTAEPPKPKPVKDIQSVESKYTDLLNLRTTLTAALKKTPKNKILVRAVNDCKESINKLIKKSRRLNAKRYYNLINDEGQSLNEVEYFKTKLSNKEQLKVMTDLKTINAHTCIEKPYRLSVLEADLPPRHKAIILQKINMLYSMDPCDSEYNKIKTWVDTVMRINFGVYRHLTVNITDGIDLCHAFMLNAKKILDDCVYGLNDAKLQILQMVGQWIVNPSAIGTAIAIKGPMGTGKTTLVKEGISRILGREFAFISLGGNGDSSYLEGHSYTYEGSNCGKIAQILIDSKCMNPVIYFDELDKISETARGEEIVGVLTHLTDTTQNNQFHDKYFSEIDFDLSKCLFIFSYNDESKVNPILRDRMYRIQTKGYDSKEKVIIAKNYLLPKIREQVAFTAEDVIIPDETIQYIVSNSAFTHNEDGVRNLKRCLEIIYTKLNLFRLVKSEDNFFSKDINMKVTFPYTVLKKDVDILIKNDETQNQSLMAMYL